MRYSFSGRPDEIDERGCDVLIVGAGIAGLYTSLMLDERYSCCILTKENVEISNSYLAQGGIAVALAADDEPQLHLNDTLIAGAGLCDEEAVKVLVEEGPSAVINLVGMGVPFDVNDEGDLHITREGGHHKNRIVHAGGDATGRETVKSLARLVARRQNVSFLSHSFFADAITDEKGEVCGAMVVDAKGRWKAIRTRNIVIATGGIGQVYLASTNPSVATGDGIAAALRAGAELSGMEFIQFHPTGLWSPNAEDRTFLISEAVRGEGGLLKNKKGERFMLGKHELNELAPRDIVARFIYKELQESGEDHCFVDITAKSADFLEHRFPTIYNECLRRGIDISKDWIPVCPVQHYMIGGVKTDLYARTAVPGLYAVGEAASTGVHGANRLASNSMLECLVFGRRAAVDINDRLSLSVARDFPLPEFPEPETGAGTPDYAAIVHEIQTLMSTYGFVVRSTAGMETALGRIRELQKQLTPAQPRSRELSEAINIAAVAESILTAALARKESVGAHYRVD